MRVAVAGGTGLVGRGLIPRLLTAGHEVLLLTRDPARAARAFPPLPANRLRILPYTPTRPGPWQRAIGDCDAVINLAGEPIMGGRWTAERRTAILQSRVLTTRHLAEAVANARSRSPVMVSASAIGYYGANDTAELAEDSPSGQDFLARVCRAWEGEAQVVTAAGVRLVVLRLGVVLAADSHLLQSLAPFKHLAGSTIGSGRQWLSWVHRTDLVDLIVAAIDRPEVAGVLNATAPHAVRMAEFSATLGRLLGGRFGLPALPLRVPSAIVRAALGDAAQVVLQGQRVLPQAALDLGFRFRYPTLEPALTEILGLARGPRR